MPLRHHHHHHLTGMADDHFIEYVWAKDSASGATVAAVKLTATDSPSLSFALPAGCAAITGFEWCNKHGAWASEATAV